MDSRVAALFHFFALSMFAIALLTIDNPAMTFVSSRYSPDMPGAQSACDAGRLKP
jgi:hypothetical protein